MGRKALHTPEEIFATADRLAAEGRDVTASALLRNIKLFFGVKWCQGTME